MHLFLAEDQHPVQVDCVSLDRQECALGNLAANVGAQEV